MHRVVAILVLLVSTVGCTQGTTPDCSTVQCGPNLDGSIADAPADSPIEASDSGADTSTDAAGDAPADAPVDGG